MSNSKPTVLITGASKGIGRDIAINLAKSGKYKLALLSRNKYKLQETAELCKNENARIAIRIFQTDATDKDKLNVSCAYGDIPDFGLFDLLLVYLLVHYQ